MINKQVDLITLLSIGFLDIESRSIHGLDFLLLTGVHKVPKDDVIDFS